MARITVQEYKDAKLNNQLKDVTITQLITSATEVIDRLSSSGLSAATLKSAELYTALYLGVLEDRKIQSERIDPSTVAYEKESYLDRLKLILGQHYPDLGLVEDGKVIQRAKVWVVTGSDSWP